jgi:hypothetical protein
MENRIFKKGDLIMVPIQDGFDKEYGVVIQTDRKPENRADRIKVHWINGGNRKWLYENTWAHHEIEIVA